MHNPNERPKGYAKWNPRPQTLQVVANVLLVLDEYEANLPLTVRQIFYRLVGAYGYDKTEKAYNRLAEYLVRARRAQLIPFSSIRDDGTVRRGGGGFYGERSFWSTVERMATSYRRDRLFEQDVAIELWCEAAGMVPQLVKATSEYSVPVFSTGGFSSVTVTHEIAQRALTNYQDHDQRTVFLHIGDYDPSGQSIFDSMAKDVLYFVIGELGGGAPSVGEDVFEAKRVALVADQVDHYDLPTAPPKATDSRSANWMDETCQAEALPPDVLAQLAEEAVEDEIDLEVHDAIVAKEAKERANVVKTAKKVKEGAHN